MSGQLPSYFEPEKAQKVPDYFEPEKQTEPDRSLGTLSYEDAGAAPKPKESLDIPGRVRSALSSATFGFAPKAVAAIETALPFTSGRSGPVDYEQARDENRMTYDKAIKDHPIENVLGNFAAPMPGVGGGKGLVNVLAHVLGGATIGGLSGAGNSKGDFGSKEQLEDIGHGALVGGGVGGALGGLGSIAQYLKGRASQGVATAVSDASTAAEKSVQKAIDSAKGAFRSGVQAASRDLEVIQREAENGVGEAKQMAQEFLAKPESQAVIDRVLKGKLTTAPQRVSEMNALEEALAKLQESKDADVAAKTGELLDKTPMKQISERVAKYAKRVIPMAVGTGVGAIGAHLGLPATASVGLAGGIGMLTGAGIGAPGTAFANAVRSPGFRAGAWGALEKLLTGPDADSALGQLGKFAAPLKAAAEKGPEALAATHYVLAKNNPEYQKLTEGLAQSKEL